MSLPWVEKYRPKTKKELLANKTAINGIYNFLKNWDKTKMKCALLIGPPGCGKTSAVYAIANDLNLIVTELNASDTRNKNLLHEILYSASRYKDFIDNDKQRLLLMDEVDGLSGNNDRGGLSELIRIIKNTRYPIVCTANDPESDKIIKLKKVCRTFEFSRVDDFTIIELLEKITKIENMDISEDVLDDIADKSAGDLRAAINELESLVSGISDYQFPERDKMQQINDFLNNVFKAKNWEDARNALNYAPSNYYLLLSYFFDETYKQCSSNSEIISTYKNIAYADVILARIMKNQNWSLLKYFFDFLGPGISKFKGKKYNPILNLPKIPSTLRYRGFYKSQNKVPILLADKASKKLHISKNKFITQEFPLIKQIIEGKKGAEIVAWFNFDNKEINALASMIPNILVDFENARQKVDKSKIINYKSDISTIFKANTNNNDLDKDKNEVLVKHQTSLEDFF